MVSFPKRGALRTRIERAQQRRREKMAMKQAQQLQKLRDQRIASESKAFREKAIANEKGRIKKAQREIREARGPSKIQRLEGAVSSELKKVR